MHSPSHVCIDSLNSAFTHMRLSTYESTCSHMDWLSHLCFLSRMNLFTYEFAFSRMDWLSHLCFLTHKPFHLWIYFLTYGLTLLPVLSHAWAFLPMNLLSQVWIDSLIFAFSHTSLFTYESAFSRMDWLSRLSFLKHEPFPLWIHFLTHGLTLSSMLSHPWVFSPMNLLSHVWVDSLTYAFSHAWAFSPMDSPSHVWSDSLTSAFSRTSVLTYESTSSHMELLSHLYFLTHEPFHLWICFLTYGLTLSLLASHAWAFSPMDLLPHVWMESLTFSFLRMSLFTYEYSFSGMDRLCQLCFLTLEPFHLWIYFLRYRLTFSPMLSHQ